MKENTQDRYPSFQPLVIVGPTASGKSALALNCIDKLQDKFGIDAEIVSADSMAVYKKMDIGTAKPSQEDQTRTPHHLVDVVDAQSEFGLSDFKNLANDAIRSIESAGKKVVVVGGTGLYVQALIDNFVMPPKYPEVVVDLEKEPDTERLWRQLESLDHIAASRMEPTNRRRILRALEVTVGSGKPFSSFGPGVDNYPPTRFRQVGLAIERQELYARTDSRFDSQIAEGLVAEVKLLSDRGISKTAAQALGYPEILKYLNGETTIDQAVDEAKQRIRRFAKRQESWFKRDPRITWFDALQKDLPDKVVNWWSEEPAKAEIASEQPPSEAH